jgi:hypothetical protein
MAVATFVAGIFVCRFRAVDAWLPVCGWLPSTGTRFMSIMSKASCVEVVTRRM